MRQKISSDSEVNRLFERACTNMQSLFGYSEAAAWSLLAEYHRLFTDKSYCEELGIGVQDDDFFFHEAPMGMALRVHYFVGLKGTPSQSDFLDWRRDTVKRLKE
ncbi:hypothetical protein ACUXIW_003869 [Ralstonia pickettii]|jgi:hypothetical protein|uniref:Uncharacterized protein n=2 Tax=Ralstonia pickettii TaxID=329 RepID=A0ABM9ITJ0_RALPI|nr:hypothetical protein [Ralstonia sp.]MBA9847580.1 hypothetical protein [Ralstonia pickettii]MCL6483313.1 hypothetical protein [Janthinobacterium lividum]MBA4236703.1 hypothetical protein [Ralstonia sp.]MBA4403319.1 hypothetical protein [Ralstonia sp.]